VSIPNPTFQYTAVFIFRHIFPYNRPITVIYLTYTVFNTPSDVSEVVFLSKGGGYIYNLTLIRLHFDHVAIIQ